jgi:CRP/FNR family transcriptional regulator, cyclic AMP receptor protein
MSLNDMARGEYFGEVTLFDDLTRTASASAMTDVMLLELSRTVLVNMLEERPSAALAILRTMSSRVRNMSAVLEDHVSKNAVTAFHEECVQVGLIQWRGW